MPKKFSRIENRRAHFDYFLYERVEAGIALLGGEVKSVKAGRASLTGSYAKGIGGEIYLVNAFINPYGSADTKSYDAHRSRKLLLHKGEIDALTGKIAGQGFSLVPVAMYIKKGNVKIELALAKGKKQWDKREQMREKDLEREEEMVIRGKGFTLVELMVVMAVIAVLAATALVAFSGVQKSARDTKRKAVVSQYRTALENYYAMNVIYPIDAVPPGADTRCTGVLETSLVPNFMSNSLGSPTNGTLCYYWSSWGGDFVLTYSLETGGEWVACSAAYRGGKVCKIASTVPAGGPGMTGCPCL